MNQYRYYKNLLRSRYNYLGKIIVHPKKIRGLIKNSGSTIFSVDEISLASADSTKKTIHLHGYQEIIKIKGWIFIEPEKKNGDQIYCKLNNIIFKTKNQMNSKRCGKK